MTDPLAAPAATAGRAILGAIVRHGITLAGTALVAHGWVDQGAAAAATPPLADYAVGALMIAGAAGWSMFRAWVSHTRWAAAWTKLTTNEAEA